MPDSHPIHDLYWLQSALDLSQADVAKRTGVSAHTICQWETGRTNPCLRNLYKLAKALKVSLDQLTMGAEL